MGRAARRAHVATRNPRTRRGGAGRSFAFHRSSLASSSISAHVNRPNETFIQAVVSLFPPRPFSFLPLSDNFSNVLDLRFDSSPDRCLRDYLSIYRKRDKWREIPYRLFFSSAIVFFFLCLSRNRDETMSSEEERRGELAELDRNPSDVA